MVRPVDFEVARIPVCMAVSRGFELPWSTILQPIVPARVDTFAVPDEVDSVSLGERVLAGSTVGVGSMTRHYPVRPAAVDTDERVDGERDRGRPRQRPRRPRSRQRRARSAFSPLAPAPCTRFIYQPPASYRRKPTGRYAPAGSEPWAWAIVCRGYVDVDSWTTQRSHAVIASTLSKASSWSPASISGFRSPTHDLLNGTNLAVSRYVSPSFKHSLTVQTATS